VGFESPNNLIFEQLKYEKDQVSHVRWLLTSVETGMLHTLSFTATGIHLPVLLSLFLAWKFEV
jgi:hypothetical protein